jgi:hypothetical protein
LLEDLAARFVNHGWSLKWLHREILASHTWRQAAVAGTKDPDNRWLAGMSRRRLDPEAWRDSILALSEQLDRSQFGPSGKLDEPAFRRRTLYGTISRQKPASLLKLFDFPDAKQHSERRVATTTPLQHLYLLNSDFMHAAAQQLAIQCLQATPNTDTTANATATANTTATATANASADAAAVAATSTGNADADANGAAPISELANIDRDNARVEWLFQRVLMRKPTAGELADARELVTTAAAAWKPPVESKPPGESKLPGESKADTKRKSATAPKSATDPKSDPQPKWDSESARWALLAHALLATNEFLHLD